MLDLNLQNLPPDASMSERKKERESQHYQWPFLNSQDVCPAVNSGSQFTTDREGYAGTHADTRSRRHFAML